MDYLIQMAISNMIVASLLALLILVLAKRMRPQWVHLMWLVVLLKLVTPPVVEIPVWQTVSTSPEVYLGQSNAVVSEIVPLSYGGNQKALPNPGDDKSDLGVLPMIFSRLWFAISAAWLAGIAGCIVVTLIRAVRFNRQLERTAVQNQAIDRLGSKAANRMGVSGDLDFVCVNANVAPMVWWLGGRIQVVVPVPMFDELDQCQKELVLAHELAHVRRCDYLVRWLEWLVNCVFWWNPLVYVARHQLRFVEEVCCDQLVLAAMNPDPHMYAQSILTSVEALVCPEVRPPVPTSQIHGGGSLERRFEMILGKHREVKASIVASTLSVIAVLILVPVGMVQSQDFERLERRLEKLVEKGHLDEEHVEIMLAALHEALEEEEHEHDEHGHDEHGHDEHGHDESDRDHGKEAHEKFEYHRNKTIEYQHRMMHQEMRKTEEKMHEASQKVMELIEEGEISEEDGHRKLEEIRRKVQARMGEIKEALNQRAIDRQPEGESSKEFWQRLERAVERGEITGEQADLRMERFKQREARAKYGELQRKIKNAVDSGKMSEAEAEEKLAAIKLEMFGNRFEKTNQDADREMEVKEIGRKLRMAVANGELTQEEARAKYKAIVNNTMSTGSKRDHKIQRDEIAELIKATWDAVKSGKLSPQQAEKKIEKLYGMMHASHDLHEHGHEHDHHDSSEHDRREDDHGHDHDD